jgi:hypothetical protein
MAEVIIGALIGAIATLAAVLPQLNQSRRQAAAGYLRALASAARGMADAFRNNGVPHDHGHAFEGLVTTYERHFKSFLPKEQLASDLERYRELAHRAADTDEGILDKVLLPSEERNALSNDLLRLAGDLEARAADLELGGRGVDLGRA